jgi:hypothetical protein
MFLRYTLVPLLLMTALAGLGCSSSGATSPPAPSCTANPTQCGVGETCWPTSSTTLACLPSDTSAPFGASCAETINVPTCADGMICDATDPSGNGQCTSYCVSTASCPSGYECQSTTIAGGGGSSGAAISICRAAGPPNTGDAGTPFPIAEGGEGGALPDAELVIPDASDDAGSLQQ